MKKEVILSLVFKVGAMGLGFITVALLIKYLGASSYGTWAALVSLLAWIQLSDFGVGYALKNRIASADKPSDMLPLIVGVFQFYIVLSMLIVCIFIIFGDNFELVNEHRSEAFILYIGMILFFPLTIGAAVLQGLQKNSISNFMILIQSALWLLCVYLWGHGASLLLLSVLYISTVLLVALAQCGWAVKLLIGNIFTGFVELKNYKHFHLALPLWNIGIRFVVLQLTSVVLFSLGTYLTYANLSPEDAAKYDVLFKFFQVFLTIFNIILSVFWPSISHAIAKCDKKLLKKKFMQLHVLALLMFIGSLTFSVFVASPFIDIYSSHEIQVTLSESLVFCGLITIQMFAYAGAVFLNAAEQLKGQIFLAVFAAVFFVPLVLYFYQQEIGFSSTPLATMVLIIPSLIYCNWRAYFHVIKKVS